MVVKMKKVLFILLLFISGNIMSADFVDDFGGYRSQIKRNLGHDTTSVSPSDSAYNQFIRQAVIKVMPIIQGKKKSFSFITNYRDDSYDLDSTVNGIISVYWSKNDSIKTLLKAPKDQWYTLKKDDENIVSQKSGYQNRPSYYDYIDDIIYLYPSPPRNGDTIKYEAYTKVTNIDNATDSLQAVPQKYRVAILEYATYLVAQSLQHPSANLYRQDFSESVQSLLGRGANVTITDK